MLTLVLAALRAVLVHRAALVAENIAWFVDLSLGFVNFNYKTFVSPVVAVRGGP